MGKREILAHPSLGRLPARRVLDCVFALAPNGTILHHHVEEMRTSDEGGDGILYSVSGQPAAEGRERCRIIPPMVRQFESVESARKTGAAS